MRIHRDTRGDGQSVCHLNPASAGATAHSQDRTLEFSTNRSRTRRQIAKLRRIGPDDFEMPAI